MRLRLGWMLPTSSVLAVKSCLASWASAIDHGGAEDRELEAEHVALTAGDLLDHPAPGEGEADGLQRLRNPRGRRSPARRGALGGVLGGLLSSCELGHTISRQSWYRPVPIVMRYGTPRYQAAQGGQPL